MRIAMMMDSLKLALLMSLVGHLYEAFSQGIKFDFVLVKTPYTFPGNASNCETAEWRKKSLPTDATIARKYKNQTCPIEKGFQGEFTCKENQLLLNSAKYTDLGHYMFVCKRVEHSLAVQLDVLYALNVHAAEMDNITLNCYAVSANDVTWLHNNEGVLYYKKGGSINPGEGYERRVSLEKNCLKTGNLSLTITGVRKTDAGIYRCFVDDETTKGYPHAYVVHVNEKRSSPGDQTDSNCNDLQVSTIVLAIVLCICVLIVVVHHCKRYCLTSKPLQYTSPTATCVQNSDDDTTENHPVQESHNTGNKPSNTRPF